MQDGNDTNSEAVANEAVTQPTEMLSGADSVTSTETPVDSEVTSEPATTPDIASEEPVAEEASVDPAPAPEPQTAVPVTIMRKVTFTGAATASIEVADGTTAQQAMKLANVNGNLMLRRANNTPMAKTYKITEDVTITTVAQARGG